jgi:hypothetical protein
MDGFECDVDAATGRAFPDRVHGVFVRCVDGFVSLFPPSPPCLVVNPLRYSAITTRKPTL